MGPKSKKKIKYYVVKRGHKPGIYMDWQEAELQIKGFSSTQANNEILHKSLDTVRSENDKLRVEISQIKEKYLHETALEIERLRTENGILHTTIEFDKTEKMRLKDSFQDLRFENDRLQNELRKMKDRKDMLEYAFSTICEDNKSMSHTTDFFNRNQTVENRTAPRTNDSMNNIPLNNRFELLNCDTNDSIMSLENEVPQTRSHEDIQSHSPRKRWKDQSKQSIIIAGDSIVKNIHQSKISRDKLVKVRSFPGATTGYIVK